jgi:hypothetical protein
VHQNRDNGLPTEIKIVPEEFDLVEEVGAALQDSRIWQNAQSVASKLF